MEGAEGGSAKGQAAGKAWPKAARKTQASAGVRGGAAAGGVVSNRFTEEEISAVRVEWPCCACRLRAGPCSCFPLGGR